VCVCVCVCARARAWIHTYICTSIYTSIYIYHTYIHLYIYISIYNIYIYTHTHTHTHISIYIRVVHQRIHLTWVLYVYMYIQHTSAYVSIRQHTSAYVSIRQHMSTLRENSTCIYIYIPLRLTYADVCWRMLTYAVYTYTFLSALFRETSSSCSSSKRY
jgi:hypothetical protein